MTTDKIDFVIPWVDEDDPGWRAEYKKWSNKLGTSSKSNLDSSDVRFRDWGLLRYWFRGIERFAPWVNRIHFVTYGHLPEWLNVDHPKLHVVKHSDFMPEDILPVFSSHPIELLLHKIDGLSENFVYFNDDTLLLQPVKRTDFFKKGVPVNTMSLHPVLPTYPVGMSGVVSNNVRLVNKNFDYKKSLRKNLLKYISPRQGKYIVKTLPLLVYNHFPGFANFHMPNSYKKATLETVWKMEGDELTTTIHHKFRDYEKDCSQWLFNYWQFANGDFVQRDVRFGINTKVVDPNIERYILQKKAKCINIGDVDDINDFESAKTKVIDAFEKILPKKSNFEK